MIPTYELLIVVLFTFSSTIFYILLLSGMLQLPTHQLTDRVPDI